MLQGNADFLVASPVDEVLVRNWLLAMKRSFHEVFRARGSDDFEVLFKAWAVKGSFARLEQLQCAQEGGKDRVELRRVEPTPLRGNVLLGVGGQSVL